MNSALYVNRRFRNTSIFCVNDKENDFFLNHHPFKIVKWSCNKDVKSWEISLSRLFYPLSVFSITPLNKFQIKIKVKDTKGCFAGQVPAPDNRDT